MGQIDLGRVTATVQVGTVTTGAPGTPAAVENIGDKQDVILNVTIPKGDPARYEDFTPEQVAELQQPATEAAQEVAQLEAAIEQAEQARGTAEQAREQAEQTRSNKEELRQAAEQTRMNHETARQQAESDRAEAETARQTAEGGREQAEQARAADTAAAIEAANEAAGAANEAAGRVDAAIEAANEAAGAAGAVAEQIAQAEQARVTAEGERAGAETARQQAETARSTADGNRAEAETARQQAESDRAEAETARQTAEGGREQAEQARATDTAAAIEAANEAAGAANEAAGRVDAAIEAANEAAGAAGAVAEQIAQAEQVRVTAEGERAEAETARQQAETARQTAEGNRAEAETARQQAETARSTAESNRADAETARQQAETARQQAESDRADAETARQTAEGGREQAEQARVTDTAAAIAAANAAAENADEAREELMAKEVTMAEIEEIMPPPTGVDTTIETIKIILTDGYGGLNLQGLPVSLYLNGSATAESTKTADENGCIVWQLPVGTRYRIAFTQVAGCDEIADEEHVALMVWRGIEVKYQEPQDGEQVTVYLRQRSGTTYTPIVGEEVDITYGTVSSHLVTDSEGKVTLLVPAGKNYSVKAPTLEGLYVERGNSRFHLAVNEIRTITYTYTAYQTGVFVVADDGSEHLLADYQALVEAGTYTNAQAKLIKVSTQALASNGGVFALDIDMVANGSYPSSGAWCSSNVQFNSIPLNGNSASADYYYDGMSASRAIAQEASERLLSVPAVTKCLNLTTYINSYSQPLQGFLGSVGQWAVLWANRSAIDEIIAAVRPDSTGRISSKTTAKWTSTQNSAGYAWSWTTAANNGSKGYSCAVIPFFAY